MKRISQAVHELAMSRSWWLVAMAALLAGCAAPRGSAPVVERSIVTPQAPTGAAPVAAAPDAASPVAPGTDTGARPGYYSVKPGDTLIRIALDHGQNLRDLVRWNAIANPNLIEVGQSLRVVPPGQDVATATGRAAPAARADARALDARAPAATAEASTPAAAAASGVPAAPLPAPAPVVREGDDNVNWLWPAAGHVASGFEEGRTKGLAILGKAGDAVLSAADGRVVYAGSGLRGYGNLVIVKHNNTYLTAYAHNQTLLVKEDQAVRRGQKIAEMGSTDAERVQLHFEIRRQGKPIDPAKLLPAR